MRNIVQVIPKIPCLIPYLQINRPCLSDNKSILLYHTLDYRAVHTDQYSLIV